jgi:hypothetical protein
MSKARAPALPGARRFYRFAEKSVSAYYYLGAYGDIGPSAARKSVCGSCVAPPLLSAVQGNKSFA